MSRSGCGCASTKLGSRHRIGWRCPIIGFDGGVTGHPFSDFLVGQASSYLQGGGEYQRLHATQLGIYIQDQIRLSRI